MKRKQTFLLCTILISFVAFDPVFALNHSGPITQDETWASEGNPHIIQDMTTVSGGATLTIEAGAEIRFNPSAGNPRLIIGYNNSAARLVAIGTDENKIIFTSDAASPQPGDWSNIVFNSTAANNSVIEHAVIEYGGYESQGSLYISGSNPAIRNCTVRYSADSGIKLYLSEAEISNCVFEANTDHGVDSDGFSGILNGNAFINNGSYPIRIYIRQYPNPVVTVPNTFTSNNPNKVYLASSIAIDYTLINFGIPYFFPGLVTVSNNATLTIEPGVEVRFNPNPTTNSRLSLISGRLIAVGTETEKIKFTSDSPTPQRGDWNNIFISQDTADDSVIEHAIIEYGGYPGQGSLYISGVSPAIRNCTVRHSADSGIKLYLSEAEISNCTFEENEVHGVECDGFSGILNGNHFARNESYPIRLYLRQKPNPTVSIPNTFESNSPDQIFFTPGVNRDYRLVNFGIPYVFTGNITVNNNATLAIDPGVEINLNTGCSLLVGGSSPGRLIARGTDTEKIKFTSNFSIPNPGDWHSIYFYSNAESSSVLENVIIEYGGGTGSLQINGSDPTIRKSTIQHSATNGISLNGSSSVITCCDIQHNSTGIYASASNPAISLNNISDNIDWGVYNSSSSMIINAKFNWWGDESGPAGSGTGSGDAVSAYVNYQPWSEVPNDCSICRGDFEPDGDVDGRNFYEILDKFGCISNCGIYDMTGDGIVEDDDIGLFALFFGRNNCLP